MTGTGSALAWTPDPMRLRRIFGCFPSGVTGLCGLRDGVAIGMAVSAFVPVSLLPPLVGVCVRESSSTWGLLRSRPRLGISVFGEQQELECRSLAGPSAHRFEGLEWTATRSGAVLIAGATAWLECSVYQELPAGDHLLVLLLVHGLEGDPAAAPLIFHGGKFRECETANSRFSPAWPGNPGDRVPRM